MSNVRRYAVVDTDGHVLWGLTSDNLAEVSEWARHPKRRVVEVGVLRVVRKSRRKAKRGGK
jgi:hypothetical protein